MESAEQYRVRVKDFAEDTIERCWIPLWNKVPKKELTRDQAKVFVTIYMMSESQAEDLISKLIKDKNNFGINLIYKSMIPRFKVRLSMKLVLWLSCLFISPGNTVMIFAYMKYIMHRNSLSSLNFDDFTTYVFPIGFPDEDGLQWLWDCQKLRAETEKEFEAMPGTGNLLDCPIAYTSFS